MLALGAHKSKLVSFISADTIIIVLCRPWKVTQGLWKRRQPQKLCILCCTSFSYIVRSFLSHSHQCDVESGEKKNAQIMCEWMEKNTNTEKTNERLKNWKSREFLVCIEIKQHVPIYVRANRFTSVIYSVRVFAFCCIPPNSWCILFVLLDRARTRTPRLTDFFFFVFFFCSNELALTRFVSYQLCGWFHCFASAHITSLLLAIFFVLWIVLFCCRSVIVFLYSFFVLDAIRGTLCCVYVYCFAFQMKWKVL